MADNNELMATEPSADQSSEKGPNMADNNELMATEPSADQSSEKVKEDMWWEQIGRANLDDIREDGPLAIARLVTSGHRLWGLFVPLWATAIGEHIPLDNLRKVGSLLRRCGDRANADLEGDREFWRDVWDASQEAANYDMPELDSLQQGHAEALLSAISFYAERRVKHLGKAR